MVTGEKFISHIIFRYRLGTLLVWLGVLTWLPFIFLQVIGGRPSFFLFLPFHLLGVIGGARLRSLARQELGLIPAKKNWFQIAGNVMIILGILVWAPYFYVKLALGQPVEVLYYLPFHLTGIFGGLGLYLINYLAQRKSA